MTTKLAQLLPVFESLWPVSGADEWDRVGLSSGSLDQQINRVLLCVDPTLEVIQEANQKSCQLVLSHHPLLLEGIHSVAEGEPKAEVLVFAIKNSIATFSAHTNADIVPGGVSDTLAQALGLKNTTPLVVVLKESGHGRVGDLTDSVSLEEFALLIQKILPRTNTGVRVAGDVKQKISRVAVVGGSGGSFLPEAILAGADCFVTSDLKHHNVLDAVQNSGAPIALVDISHYGAESLWLKPASEQLSKLVPSVEFLVSEINTDPWSMYVSESK